MLMIRRLILILSLHCLISGTLSWRPFVFIYNKIYLVGENTKLISTSVFISKTAQGVTSLNSQFNLKQKVDLMLVNLVLKNVPRENTKPLSMNLTTDLCSLFKRPILPPIASGIYKVIKARMDMPTRCPIEKGVYNITEVQNIEEEFPPYLPLNAYTMNLKFYVSTSESRQIEDLNEVTVNVRVALNKAPRPTRPKKNRG